MPAQSAAAGRWCKWLEPLARNVGDKKQVILEKETTSGRVLTLVA